MAVLSPGRVARILINASRYRCIAEAAEIAALATSHEFLRGRVRLRRPKRRRASAADGEARELGVRDAAPAQPIEEDAPVSGVGESDGHLLAGAELLGGDVHELGVERVHHGEHSRGST
jgi:hypothetical protein